MSHIGLCGPETEGFEGAIAFPGFLLLRSDSMSHFGLARAETEGFERGIAFPHIIASLVAAVCDIITAHHNQLLILDNVTVISPDLSTSDDENAADSMFLKENTTVWSSSFEIGNVDTCDSRATSSDMVEGEGQPGNNDKFQKHIVISADISLVPSGSVKIVRKCTGILRYIVQRCEGISLRELVRAFESLPVVGGLKKIIKGYEISGDPDGIGCSLILSTTKGRHKTSVYKIRLTGEITVYAEIEKRTRDKESTEPCGLGAGSGFSTACQYLNKLSYYSSLEEIKDVVKRAYVETARSDPRTGGTVFIYHGSWGSRKRLIEYYPIAFPFDPCCSARYVVEWILGQLCANDPKSQGRSSCLLHVT